MPVLGPQSGAPDPSSPEPVSTPEIDARGSGNPLSRPRGFYGSCANPDCRTGWLHLFRRRSVPNFEGGWSCSAACTERRLEQAVRRELEGHGRAPGVYRHRIPLGLLMLEQRWIDAGQLRRALESQRRSGEGRLGSWLVRQEGVSELLVARALGLQWSCPVVSLPFHDREAMAPALPRLFVDAFGALPLRMATGRMLYLGFEDRPDPVVALGLERMHGLRVEPVLVPDAEFRLAHMQMLTAHFPRVELLEISSKAQLARALARVVEKVRPVESRLVRMYDFLWLRMWRRAVTGVPADASAVEDVVCALGGD